MSLLRLAIRSLAFYGGMLWPVALGVAAATAVITGALLVGDSVRGSLRYLALDRLGAIEQVLLAPRFFSAEALQQIALNPDFSNAEIGTPLPAIIFPTASIERSDTNRQGGGGDKRSANVLVLGINSDFWSLGQSMPPLKMARNEIVLNQSAADELGAAVGDLLTLRLPSQQAVPADNPLGRRENETVNLARLKVIHVLPDRSLGRFDLRSNQTPTDQCLCGDRNASAGTRSPRSSQRGHLSFPRCIFAFVDEERGRG